MFELTPPSSPVAEKTGVPVDPSEGAANGQLDIAYGQGSDGDLTFDAVFDILSNSKRRRCVRLVSAQPGITKRELTARVTAAENEDEATGHSATTEKSVYVTLHQTHLPKLYRQNIVAQDGRDGFYPTAQCVFLDSILDAVHDLAD